ncbi:MAG: hypothetical protein ACE5HS_01775 [bacterium]
MDSKYQAGNYTVPWDGRGPKGNLLASGVYFYQLRTGEEFEIRKMSLLR